MYYKGGIDLEPPNDASLWTPWITKKLAMGQRCVHGLTQKVIQRYWYTRKLCKRALSFDLKNIHCSRTLCSLDETAQGLTLSRVHSLQIIVDFALVFAPDIRLYYPPMGQSQSPARTTLRTDDTAHHHLSDAIDDPTTARISQSRGNNIVTTDREMDGEDQDETSHCVATSRCASPITRSSSSILPDPSCRECIHELRHFRKRKIIDALEDVVNNGNCGGHAMDFILDLIHGVENSVEFTEIQNYHHKHTKNSAKRTRVDFNVDTHCFVCRYTLRHIKYSIDVGRWPCCVHHVPYHRYWACSTACYHQLQSHLHCLLPSVVPPPVNKTIQLHVPCEPVKTNASSSSLHHREQVPHGRDTMMANTVHSAAFPMSSPSLTNAPSSPNHENDHTKHDAANHATDMTHTSNDTSAWIVHLRTLGESMVKTIDAEMHFRFAKLLPLLEQRRQEQQTLYDQNIHHTDKQPTWITTIFCNNLATQRQHWCDVILFTNDITNGLRNWKDSKRNGTRLSALYVIIILLNKERCNLLNKSFFFLFTKFGVDILDRYVFFHSMNSLVCSHILSDSGHFDPDNRYS